MRFLLLFFATASCLLAAAGDILSVAVRSEGWTADIEIEGKLSGGTYDFGLGTNNNPLTGTPKIVFTVVSHSFTDAGVATTKSRSVYGTFPQRKAYPNDATNEELESGGNVTVRVILSDYIYQEDNTGAGNSGTSPTVSILSGFYTQSGGNNASGAGFAVSNNSTVAFQSVIANWSWPGYQRMTPSTRLRAVAFHRHGQEYRPVRAVKFTVTDGSTTNEEIVTAPTITPGFGDALPVVEYVTTASLVTGLTQGAELTANFIAYPWIGDNAADSSTGAAAPTAVVGPHKHLCDVNETYQITVARVDPATGSDAGANTVYPVGSYNPSTAYKFASIGKAASAIAAYNNATYGRNDVGGGIVKLDAGNYAWLGSSNTYGTTPLTYITVIPNDGVATGDVVINSKSGNADISDRVKIENCTFTSATGDTCYAITSLWLHGCVLNSSGTGVLGGTSGVWYATQCTIPQWEQGLRPFSTTNYACALARGNSITGMDAQILIYTVLGNSQTVNAVASVIDAITGQLSPKTVPILAYNSFLGLDTSGSEALLIGRGSVENTFGAAIVQNVFETATTGSPGIATVGVLNYEYNNHILWHNTFVGQRAYLAYNDLGSVAYYRKYWSQINNYHDRWANKGDNFSPYDGARIGGWPVKFGVGTSGEYYSQNMFALPGDFYAEFAGIGSYQPNDATYGTAGEALFVDRQSALPVGTGSAISGAGQGDYDIQDGSPLIGIPIVNVIPYDLDGVLRTAENTAAGAFAGPAAAPSSTINATITNATNINVQ